MAARKAGRPRLFATNGAQKARPLRRSHANGRGKSPADRAFSLERAKKSPTGPGARRVEAFLSGLLSALKDNPNSLAGEPQPWPATRPSEHADMVAYRTPSRVRRLGRRFMLPEHLTCAVFLGHRGLSANQERLCIDLSLRKPGLCFRRYSAMERWRPSAILLVEKSKRISMPRSSPTPAPSE